MPSKRTRKTNTAAVLRHHVFDEVSVIAVHKLDGDRTALVVLDEDGVQRMLLADPIFWATSELDQVTATLPVYSPPKPEKIVVEDGDREEAAVADIEEEAQHIDDLPEPVVEEPSEDATELAADDGNDGEGEEVTACDRD